MWAGHSPGGSSVQVCGKRIKTHGGLHGSLLTAELSWGELLTCFEIINNYFIFKSRLLEIFPKVSTPQIDLMVCFSSHFLFIWNNFHMHSSASVEIHTKIHRWALSTCGTWTCLLKWHALKFRQLKNRFVVNLVKLKEHTSKMRRKNTGRNFPLILILVISRIRRFQGSNEIGLTTGSMWPLIFS